MTEKIDLPNNEWAEIRTAGEVPERLRRNYAAASGALMGQTGVTVNDDNTVKVNAIDPILATTGMGPLHDATILMHVKSWSLRDEEGGALGITADSLLDLAAETYDALLGASETAQKASKPFIADPSQAADPDSPTEPLAE